MTTIHAISGHDPLVTEYAIKTWGPGTPVASIVRELAGKLEGVRIGPIQYITAKVGKGGWCACDDTRATLDRLAREFGFSWTIIDDSFQAVGDLKALAKGPIIKSPYLIEANPILSGPRQLTKGISAKCTFNSALKPGDYVTIQSGIEEKVNGEFVLNWLAHNLDCQTPLNFNSELVAYNRRTG